MEKKTSSVEWLVEQIKEKLWLRIDATDIGKIIIQQAKEMHREEIEEAYKKGFEDVNAEQYYNETYGKDN